MKKLKTAKKKTCCAAKIMLGFASAFFLFISCTDSNITNATELRLDLVMKKSDSIHVYYTTDGSINFNETHCFWTKVKGSSRNQRVTLKFPADVMPKQIRLDIGNDKSQGDIVLNRIEVQYHKNEFIAKGREIYQFFRVDESNTILDKDLGTLKRKNPERAVGPSLYPNGEALREKLEQLHSK